VTSPPSAPADGASGPGRFVVGIDIGTTGLKAVALDDRARLVRERTVRYPTRLAGLSAEQDAEAWWDAARTALPEVVAAAEVAGVSVTWSRCPSPATAP
jgi:sugar (pentulose or hexulose) kinase